MGGCVVRRFFLFLILPLFLYHVHTRRRDDEWCGNTLTSLAGNDVVTKGRGSGWKKKVTLPFFTDWLTHWMTAVHHTTYLLYDRIKDQFEEMRSNMQNFYCPYIFSKSPQSLLLMAVEEICHITSHRHIQSVRPPWQMMTPGTCHGSVWESSKGDGAIKMYSCGFHGIGWKIIFFRNLYNFWGEIPNNTVENMDNNLHSLSSELSILRGRRKMNFLRPIKHICHIFY